MMRLAKGHLVHLLCILLVVLQQQFATTASRQGTLARKSKKPISKQEADFLNSSFALCKETRPANAVDAVKAQAYIAKLTAHCVKDLIVRMIKKFKMTAPDTYATTKLSCLTLYVAYGYFSVAGDHLLTPRTPHTGLIQNISVQFITGLKAGGKVLSTRLGNGRVHTTNWTAIETMFGEGFVCVNLAGGLPRNGNYMLLLLKYLYSNVF